MSPRAPGGPPRAARSPRRVREALVEVPAQIVADLEKWLVESRARDRELALADGAEAGVRSVDLDGADLAAALGYSRQLAIALCDQLEPGTWRLCAGVNPEHDVLLVSSRSKSIVSAVLAGVLAYDFVELRGLPVSRLDRAALDATVADLLRRVAPSEAA